MLSQKSMFTGELVLSTAASLQIGDFNNYHNENIFAPVMEQIESAQMELLAEVKNFISQKKILNQVEKKNIVYYSLRIGLLNELCKLTHNSQQHIKKVSEMEMPSFFNPLRHLTEIVYRDFKSVEEKKQNFWDTVTNGVSYAFSFFKPESTELTLYDDKIEKPQDYSAHIHFIMIVLDQYSNYVNSEKINAAIESYIHEMIDANHASPLEKLFIIFSNTIRKNQQIRDLMEVEYQFCRNYKDKISAHRDKLTPHLYDYKGDRLSNYDKKMHEIYSALMELFISLDHDIYRKQSLAAVFDADKNLKLKQLISPMFIALQKMIVKDKEIRASIHVQLTDNEVNKAYQFFNLTPNCDFDEVKKCYKKMILKSHPDKNQSLATDQFFEVHQAFEVLRKNHERNNQKENNADQLKLYTDFIFQMGYSIEEIMKEATVIERKFLSMLRKVIENDWVVSNEEQMTENDGSDSDEEILTELPEKSFQAIYELALEKFKNQSNELPGKKAKYTLDKFDFITQELFIIQEFVADMLTKDDEIRKTEMLFQTQWKDLSLDQPLQYTRRNV